MTSTGQIEGDPGIPIEPKDLRIDTFVISGRQDRPVRITHLPTGVQVTASGEATEAGNKAKAMRLLFEKLPGSFGEGRSLGVR